MTQGWAKSQLNSVFETADFQLEHLSSIFYPNVLFQNESMRPVVPREIKDQGMFKMSKH